MLSFSFFTSALLLLRIAPGFSFEGLEIHIKMICLQLGNHNAPFSGEAQSPYSPDQNKGP